MCIVPFLLFTKTCLQVIILTMELKFLTPTLVWADYDPTSTPLETTILNNSQEDNFVRTEYCFTSETTASGRVRVSSLVYFDSRWVDQRPAIIVLPTLHNSVNPDIICKGLVKSGYVAIVVDYANCTTITSDKTSFPEELKYAEYPLCREYMYDVKTSAKETPWFIWAKITRRAISFAREHRLVLKDRIGLLGFGTGGHISWMVAGVDDRLKALMPIDAGGYIWCRDRKRFGTEAIPKTDEESAFSTGVGAETYARTVKCPVLLVLSSNSDYFDIDRSGDIFTLVPAANKHLLITKNTNGQITNSTLQCVETWLSKYLAHDNKIIPNPTATFEVSEGHIMFHLDTGSSPTNIQLYLSTGKDSSAVRSWTEITDLQRIGANNYIAKINIIDQDEYITAFANVTYTKGIQYSTPVIAILPDKYGLTENVAIANSSSRIIYNGSMGLGNFIVESSSFIVADNALSVKKGPFNIKGISTNIGNLVLFRSSYETLSEDKNIIFRFDAYSPNARKITISLISLSNNESYSTDITLKGGEHWQGVSLDAQSFKNNKGKSLIRFSDINKFVFSGAEDVIFNNILWV